MKKEIVRIFLLNFYCLLFFIADRLFKKICSFNQKLLACQKNPNFLFIINNNFFIYLIIIIFIGIIFLIIKNYQIKKIKMASLLTLILFGGFSNFLDRLQFGYVIDLFNFFNIFTFNLADVMIFVGAVVFIIKLFKRTPPIN